MCVKFPRDKLHLIGLSVSLNWSHEGWFNYAVQRNGQ